MNYEIVTLEKKKVVGISARTGNADPKMSSIIGGLWERFYSDGIAQSIENRSNEKALGIYTDYDGQSYNVIVACEVSEADSIPENTIMRIIPAGKYAKFVVAGDMVKAVSESWNEIWQMDLPRSYEYDFEEYQNADTENAEIHIYLSLK